MYEHINVRHWAEAKLPDEWWKFGKKIIWHGAKLTIDGTGDRNTLMENSVILDEGHWPSDEDLITLCNNQIPPHSTHFGGKVTKNGKTAKVVVYTD